MFDEITVTKYAGVGWTIRNSPVDGASTTVQHSRDRRECPSILAGSNAMDLCKGRSTMLLKNSDWILHVSLDRRQMVHQSSLSATLRCHKAILPIFSL